MGVKFSFLVWAPNIEGLHTEEMAKMVYEELAYAHKKYKSKNKVIKALRKLGEKAAKHTRGNKY